VPAVPDAVNRGWVMVAPDYVGMGTAGPTPYLIGTGEAYPSLDAVRAAQHLSGLSLSDQTVVWGHSQGGHAALWTGKLAASYAPELKILGVAALAPATDLVPLATRVQHSGSGAGTVVSAYLLRSYSNTYSDVRFDDYVRPGAHALISQAADRCLTDPGLAASVILASTGQSAFSKDESTGPFGDRLRANTPDANLGGIPLFVAQGTGDEVINIAIAQKWVPDQCAAGYKLAFKTYPELTHMVLLSDATFTTDLVSWTVDRFAGNSAPNTCG
jgi:pimeloyl-ACP methyl ester carboxylesterase